MASTNPTSYGTDDILMFGSYYQTIVAMDSDLHGRKLLHPEEISFIREITAYDNSTAAMACQERLNLEIDYYYAVKHQITSVLRLWDAVLDEKRRYDALGRFQRSRHFLDSFQLCSYIIPQRVSIGFLGPYADILVDTNFDSMAALVSCQPAPYYTEPSTIFDGSDATAVDPAEDGGSAMLHEEEQPELALSINSSDDNFEQTGIQDEIISLYSDRDSDIDSGYSGDEELQFPLELEDVVVADGAGQGSNSNWHSTRTDFRETQAHELSGLTQDSPAWERFLSCLSKIEQPYQGGANREGLAQQSPFSNGGAPQPPSLMKRKSSAFRDGYEEEATDKVSFKRSRR